MKQMLYFHGGPGMNANPEKHLLTSRYQDRGFELKFWNEPSLQRPAGFPYREKDAFQNLLDSAEAFLLDLYKEEPLILFGFCYGCIPVLHLLRLHPEKIGKVILTTPDFCFKQANENMFRLSVADYEQHGNDQAAKALKQILAKHDGSFDQNTIQGFHYYINSPDLFGFYWSDKALMDQFTGYFSGVENSLDIDAFFAVRKSMYDVRLKSCSTPALLIYGKQDRIISIDEELHNLQGQFRDIQIVAVDCDHYVHIEALDECLNLVTEFVGAK